MSSFASVIGPVRRRFYAQAWDWVKLHNLQEKPAVKYSWVFLAVVPFLMRLIIAWQPKVAFVLDVPVNFVLCYFSSLCFLAASVFYGKGCPALVQKAPSYGAFQREQHSEVELRNWFREIVPAPTDPTQADPDLVLQYLSLARGYANISAAELAERLTGIAGPAIMNPFWATSAGPRLPDVHDFALSVAKGRHPVARGWASLMYRIGFVFLAGVFLYNSYSAYNYFARKPAPAAHSMAERIQAATKRRMSETEIARAAALLTADVRCAVTISYHNGDAIGGALADDLSRMLARAGFPPSTTQAMDAATTEVGITLRTAHADTKRGSVVALQAALKAVGIEAEMAVDPAIPLVPGTDVAIHIAN